MSSYTVFSRTLAHCAKRRWDTRIPGPRATPMAWDGRAVAFTRVERWPQVGAQSFVFFDDPADGSWEQWRVSGTIRPIIPTGTAVAAR